MLYVLILVTSPDQCHLRPDTQALVSNCLRAVGEMGQGKESIFGQPKRSARFGFFRQKFVTYPSRDNTVIGANFSQSAKSSLVIGAPLSRTCRDLRAKLVRNNASAP